MPDEATIDLVNQLNSRIEQVESLVDSVKTDMDGPVKDIVDKTQEEINDAEDGFNIIKGQEEPPNPAVLEAMQQIRTLEQRIADLEVLAGAGDDVFDENEKLDDYNYYEESSATDEKVGIDADATPDYIGANYNDGVIRIDINAGSTVQDGVHWNDQGDYIEIAVATDDSAIIVDSGGYLGLYSWDTPANSKKETLINADYVLIYDTETGGIPNLKYTTVSDMFSSSDITSAIYSTACSAVDVALQYFFHADLADFTPWEGGTDPNPNVSNHDGRYFREIAYANPETGKSYYTDGGIRAGTFALQGSDATNYWNATDFLATTSAAFTVNPGSTFTATPTTNFVVTAGGSIQMAADADSYIRPTTTNWHDLEIGQSGNAWSRLNLHARAASLQMGHSYGLLQLDGNVLDLNISGASTLNAASHSATITGTHWIYASVLDLDISGASTLDAASHVITTSGITNINPGTLQFFGNTYTERTIDVIEPGTGNQITLTVVAR